MNVDSFEIGCVERLSYFNVIINILFMKNGNFGRGSKLVGISDVGKVFEGDVVD